MSVLVLDGGRVAEVRDGRVAVLGTLPAGTPATVFRPGRPTVPARAGPDGPVLVDAGATGTRIHRDGLVQTVPVGGRDLDRAVAELAPGAALDDVRILREALSLCPAGTVATPAGPVRLTAAQVREAIAPPLARIVAGLPRGTPLVLAGGVARTPLLAELCDATGVRATVAARPETALVERAARDRERGTPAREDRPPGPGVTGPGAVPPPAGEAAAVRLPAPPVRRGRGLRRVGLGCAALLAAAGLLGIGALLPVPADGLVAHGYRLALPAGWVHAGGEPAERRVLLRPADTPEGSAVIAVQRVPLGYDADVEGDRAVAELRGLAPAAAPDGRWWSYPEGPVRWWVRFEGTDELAVGCRAAGDACALVRDSLVRDR